MHPSDPTNALRFLSIDAVQKANSGHPGMPMGMAEIATSLWSNHLKHNPLNPHWFNRDRFVFVKWAWFDAFIQLTPLNRL